MEQKPLVVEVTSIVKAGVSLFSHMMKTVDQLEPGQPLIVKSPFNPRPLLSQMRRRGYQVTQERVGKLVVTTFVPQPPDADRPNPAARSPAPPIEGPETFLDNRGLVPPDPMQRTLAALETAAVGTVLVIHNDRVPVFLLAQLDEDGYPYETQARADDSAVVRILKSH